MAAHLRQPLEVAHQQPAADGELREEDVKDAQPADHQPLHDGAEVVDGVEVHENSEAEFRTQKVMLWPQF